MDWANPLGWYNMWLFEQEREKHELIQWMKNNLAYYSRKINEWTGQNQRHYRSYGRRASR